MLVVRTGTHGADATNVHLAGAVATTARDTLRVVETLEPRSGRDDERPVDFDAEESPVLPEQTRDDVDTGWGEWSSATRSSSSNDERLLEDRPPHWG
jgi:MoxR-like ATPase